MGNDHRDLPPDWLDRVDALARVAGEAILRIYARGWEVTEKADGSPVTEADLAAHRILVDGLRALEPQLPVLSEESRHVPWEQRRLWRRYWLVDPLDGTKEFIKRNGEFTVNVALIDAGEPVLGVVHAPASATSYRAWRGGGAWRSQDGGPWTRIRVTPLPDGRPWRVMGSRSHGGERMRPVLDRLGPHELIPVGSSLKTCRVAEGNADFYARPGPTSEWDTAAAHAVLREAGGNVLRLPDLSELRYNQKAHLLNPWFVAVAGLRADLTAALASLTGPGEHAGEGEPQ